MHNDSIVIGNFMLSIGLNGKLDQRRALRVVIFALITKVDNAAGRAAIFKTACRAFESSALRAESIHEFTTQTILSETRCKRLRRHCRETPKKIF
jgi:hypothetical protein